MLAGAANVTSWLLACVTVVGVGITVVSAAGTVLLVRSVRDDVLARVLGVLGTMRAAAMTIGSLATPLLVYLVGVRATLVATGALTPLTALVAKRALKRIDDESSVPEYELRLLRTPPVFAPILPVALERLAARLEPITVPADTTVVHEGDDGDRVYLVGDGRLEVSSNHRTLDVLEAGELFGEMALLRGQPRNATVTALEDVTLYSLGKDEFLAAVSGHPSSNREAEDLITARLDGTQHGRAPLKPSFGRSLRPGRNCCSSWATRARHDASASVARRPDGDVHPPAIPQEVARSLRPNSTSLAAAGSTRVLRVRVSYRHDSTHGSSPSQHSRSHWQVLVARRLIRPLAQLSSMCRVALGHCAST
jgi:CRP-like cAMP-binding protein